MDIITVKLLGTPMVELNGEQITFPYKKSEGLFYYVCLHKSVAREEAINMFWGDSNENTGRKNLRDALYNIKNSIHENLFSHSKAVIEFSKDFILDVDTDKITAHNALKLYKDDLLSNFYIKNCYNFENWVSEKKEYYKSIYLNSVNEKIKELISISDFKSIEKYGNILIKNDPYDEKTYRYLMKIYALSEDYNKAIKLYNELNNVLLRDLDVEPELKTKKMYYEIIELKSTIDADANNSSLVNLKNKVENLTDYYTIYHETYPALLVENYDTSYIYDIESELKDIEKDMTHIDILDTDYIKIKMEASYLAGRYYISAGEYEKGVNNINISIKLSKKLDNIIYLLNNYKQMIYFAIQTDNNNMMNEYINKCLLLLDRKDNIEERGIILRLKGLYHINTKNYLDAENCLYESISIFESLNKFNKKYGIYISASYNYLGKMNKNLGNFDMAYEFFMKAINICEENSIMKGLEIFYSNSGQALYHLDRFEEAEMLLDAALEYFDKFKVIWGKDLAEYYKALIEMKKGNLKKAEIHMENSRQISKKLRGV